SKMIETNPEFAAPDAPKPVAEPTPWPQQQGKAPPPSITVPQPPSPLAPPDVKAFQVQPQAPDNRHFEMPKQTVDNVKGLAEKGVSMAGGPQAILTKAITMLEQNKIDKLQAQIDAANEDANLNQVASAAADIVSKQKAYEANLKTLVNDV